MAHGALFAGNVANNIFHLGATLPQYRLEILLLVVVLLMLFLGPISVFAPQLARTKRTGLREYGTLAQRYVREFDAKWLRGGAPAGEPLVGSADIQSLADLGNSYEIVRSMRVLPVTRDAILQLTLATLAPIAPLLLTIMPLEELLKKLFGMLF
jgi:AcrR family transcriptional regulator